VGRFNPAFLVLAGCALAVGSGCARSPHVALANETARPVDVLVQLPRTPTLGFPAPARRDVLLLERGETVRPDYSSLSVRVINWSNTLHVAVKGSLGSWTVYSLECRDDDAFEFRVGAAEGRLVLLGDRVADMGCVPINSPEDLERLLGKEDRARHSDPESTRQERPPPQWEPLPPVS